MVEDTADLARQLKERGLSCPKLRVMENKERNDAKNARQDASRFRAFGFNGLADTQEKVANAQTESAETLKSLREKVCGLK